MARLLFIILILFLLFGCLHLEVVASTSDEVWAIIAGIFAVILFALTFTFLSKLRKVHASERDAMNRKYRQEIVALKKKLKTKSQAVDRLRVLDTLLAKEGITYDQLLCDINNGGRCRHTHDDGKTSFSSCCALVSFLTNENEVLKRHVEALQTRHKLTVLQLKEKLAQAKTAQGSDSGYESDDIPTHGRIYLLEREVAHQAEEIASLKSEIDLLNEARNAIEKEADQKQSALQTKLEGLQKNLAACEEQRQAFNEAHAKEQRINAELREQIVAISKDLKETKESSTDVQADLRKSLIAKEQDIEHTHAHLINFSHSNASLQTQIGNLNQQLTEAKAQSAQDTKEIEQLVTASEKLEEELRETRAQLQRASEQVVQATQSPVSELASMMSSLSVAELDPSTPASNELESVVIRLQTHLAEREVRIGTLETQLAQVQPLATHSATIELEQQINSLQSEVGTRDSTIAKLQTQLEEAQSHPASPPADASVQMMGVLSAQLADANATITDLRSQLQQANEQSTQSVSSEAERSIAGLSDEVAARENIISDLRSQLNQEHLRASRGTGLTAEQISEARKRFAKLERDYNELQGRCKSLEIELRIKDNAVSLATNEFNDLLRQNANLQRERVELERRPTREVFVALQEERDALAQRPTQAALVSEQQLTAQWQQRAEQNIREKREIQYQHKVEMRTLKEQNHKLEQQISEKFEIAGLKPNEIAIDREKAVEQGRAVIDLGNMRRIIAHANRQAGAQGEMPNHRYPNVLTGIIAVANKYQALSQRLLSHGVAKTIRQNGQDVVDIDQSLKRVFEALQQSQASDLLRQCHEEIRIMLQANGVQVRDSRDVMNVPHDTLRRFQIPIDHTAQLRTIANALDAAGIAGGALSHRLDLLIQERSALAVYRNKVIELLPEVENIEEFDSNAAKRVKAALEPLITAHNSLPLQQGDESSPKRKAAAELKPDEKRLRPVGGGTVKRGSDNDDELDYGGDTRPGSPAEDPDLYGPPRSPTNMEE